jgi:hypothetical protein
MTGAATGRRPIPGFSPARPVLRAAVAGAIAGAVGIAASELLAGVVAGTPSLVEVRTTDGTGALQTATPGGPAPAGATGYDQVQVTVA